MRDGTQLRRHLPSRGHQRRSQFVRHRRSGPEDHRDRGWMHRDDGAIESLGSQIRTSCDRPGGGDEIGGLVLEDGDVPPGGPLMQPLHRRRQLLAGANSSPDRSSWSGKCWTSRTRSATSRAAYRRSAMARPTSRFSAISLTPRGCSPSCVVPVSAA